MSFTKEYLNKVAHFQAKYPIRKRNIRVKDYWYDNYIDTLTNKEYVKVELYLCGCVDSSDDKIWICITIAGNDDSMMEMAKEVPFEEIGKVYKHMKTIYRKLPHDVWLQDYATKVGFEWV